MKYKDYFSTLKTQGKISNEAFDKFLETVPEGEFPDDVFQVLESTFMTAERAYAHKDVAGKLRGEILDPLRNDIKEMLKHLPANIVMDVEKEESVYKKLAAINKGLPEAFQKAAKAPNDEEAKKKFQEIQAANQELLAKFEKVNSESEKYKKDLQSEFDGKIKSYKLDSELERRANSFTFAEAYKETRGPLTKAILNELKSKNKLELVEKEGEYDIQILDENGTPRFQGNTPVTINALLEEPFKPFLKMNNADGNSGSNREEVKQYRVNDQKPGTRQGATVSVQV